MALSRNNSSSVSFRISFERIYICICCILIFFTYYLNINYTPLIYKILDKSPLINEGQLKQHKIKAIYSKVLNKEVKNCLDNLIHITLPQSADVAQKTSLVFNLHINGFFRLVLLIIQ